MKLAIFFIIVGISSCFVDAHNKLDCALKMDQGQAHSMAFQAVQMFVKYHGIKDSADLCAIRCCWESILFCIKLIAGATGCPYDAMCWTVVTCLPQSYIAYARQIHTLLVAEDWVTLHSIRFPLDVMRDTCMCTVRQILKSHNHNCDDLAGDAVLLLVSTTPVMGKVVDSLKLCGLNLGFVTQTVSGVTSLVLGTGTKILCGGGLGPVDLKNLAPLMTNLLGVDAASALASLSDIVGSVLSLIGGLLEDVPLLSGGAGGAEGLTGATGGILKGAGSLLGRLLGGVNI